MAAVAKTRRVRPISSQLPSMPTSTCVPDASIHHASATVEPTATTSQSLKPVKSPTIKSIAAQKQDSKKAGGGAEEKIKKAASQKVTMDTSQKVKFAIVNSQNTSMQMNLSQRQPVRGIGKETSSLAIDGKFVHGKPNLKSSRLKQERQPNNIHVASSEGLQSRPFSRPTPGGTDSHLSASSYQRYIISQTTDHRNVDSSNLTTKAANTPAPIVIEQGVSVSVSGVDSSFQPSKIDFSSKSYESLGGGETSEGLDNIHSQSMSQLEGETDSESYSRPDSSNSYSMSEEQVDSPLLQGEVAASKPQSGRVTIEVDMRFSSSVDRPVSELSQLSSSLGGDGTYGGGTDGLLSMSAVSEQSRAASSQDGSQIIHTLTHEVHIGSEADMADEVMDGDRRSKLESASALSLGASEARSAYQESERGDKEGANFHEEDGAEIRERHGMDVTEEELQASKIVFQHQGKDGERDSQPYSSKRSSISYPSGVESDNLSSAKSSRIDPMEHEDLIAKQEHFDKQSKMVASLERLDKRAPTISTTDEPEDPSISDRKLPDISSTQLQAFGVHDHNNISKSFTVLHDSLASDRDKQLSSPYSRSLSSIGMPPSFSPLLPASRDATTTGSSLSEEDKGQEGEGDSSLLTPSQPESVTTGTVTAPGSQSQTRSASQRSSFVSSSGSVQSSVPSMKPSATHMMMIEGLQHLSTSGSHADTSSWLLAHHSGSKIPSEFPAVSEERGRDVVDLVDGGESFDKESMKDVGSDIEGGDSKSLLSENLQDESQSSKLQTLDSREISNVTLTSTKADDGAKDVDEIEQTETETGTHNIIDKIGVSRPTAQLLQVEPPEIKVVVSSESQEESAPTDLEGVFTMADLVQTQIHAVKDSDMVDTADQGKSQDSTPVNLAVSTYYTLACQ